MKIGEYAKEFWKFLKKDTWPSFAATLLIALIIIKFIFFPLLSLLTGSTLPLVIVESCSMYHHEAGFEKTFESDVYEKNGIGIEDTISWPFQNGFTKGDVIFVIGPGDVEVGDVIIFNAGEQHPLIHRVVEVDENFATKGDNYKTNYNQLTVEKNISGDQIIGEALFRIPLVGWAKLIFFEFGRDEGERGICS